LENEKLPVKIVQFEHFVNQTQEIYNDFLCFLSQYIQDLPIVVLFPRVEKKAQEQVIEMNSKDIIHDILKLWTHGSGLDSIFYGAHGKPYLQTISFNYSQSEEWVGLVIAGSEYSVGIDIESKHKVSRCYPWDRINRLQAIIDNFYTLNEKHYFEHLLEEKDYEVWRDHFFIFWTMKEALVKALGESIGSHSQLIDLIGSKNPSKKVMYRKRIWYTQSFSQKSLFGSISMDSQFDLQYTDKRKNVFLK